MLSKEFLDTISYPITQLYMASENRLLAMIVKELKTATNSFDVDTWKVQKLSNMGGLSQKAIKEISKTSKKAKQLLAETLDKISQKALETNGVDATETVGVRQAIKAMQAQANNHLNIVNTNMIVGTQDSFGELVARLDNERTMILNDATVDLVTGQVAYREAVAQSIKELGAVGINAYVDKAGRQWTPEAYVSMDLRTTYADTARKVVEEQGHDYGLDVILVSSHAGARPLCEPYQGRCYSMSGRYGTITDARGHEYEFEPIDNTSRGEPAGLFGINCGHTFRYIEEGSFVNREKPVETEEERKENQRQYALSQEQRAIEREIRTYEREAELLKEGGLTEFAKISDKMASDARAEYKEFCDANGRTPRWERTNIY